MNLAASFVVWLGGLFPDWEDPQVFNDLSGFLTTLVAAFAGLGIWVPWAVIGLCVGVQVSAWGLSLSGKTVRALASHIPFFGGSGG
jgi:hypothetical protein